MKIAHDATSRVRHEHEREQILDQAQARQADAAQACALKDEFLAVMSHELRQPLNMINISSELLARMPEIRESPALTRIATVMRNAVTSQSKIIDDLMDMARARTGKLSLAVAPLDIGRLLRDIVDAERAGPGGRDVTITFDDGSEGALVLADRVRIEQVAMNLLSNAIKFTPGGGTIAVRTLREDGAVRVDVTDTGQGIAPDFLPHVFDMYGQSLAVATRTKRGLGIGLALVREILSLHGGRVEAFSEGSGKGARLSFWLPLLDAAAWPKPAAYEGPADSMAGVRILVVDGMQEMLEVFLSLLQANGAVVFGTTDADEALRILERERVDLLIVDMSMPAGDGDGDALLRRVRAHPRYASLPAIAIGGMQGDNDVAEAYAAGYSAYLGKPVSMERLDTIVRDLMARRSLQ